MASSLRTDSIISNSDFQVPTGPITNSSNQGTIAILYSSLYLWNIIETPRISVYATKGVDTLSKNPWSSIKQRSKFELWFTNPIQQTLSCRTTF